MIIPTTRVPLRGDAENPTESEWLFGDPTLVPSNKFHEREVDGRLDFQSFNVSIERVEIPQLPEHEMILHMIGDAIACLKDAWVTKAEKVDAFNWLFAPTGSEDPDDDWSLDFWCRLIDMNPVEVQSIATVFLISDLRYANRVRFWW